MKNLFKVWSLAIVLALGVGEAFGQFTWTKDARNPVFSGVNGTWSTHVFCPCVLFNSDSGRYEMWFNATIGPSAYPNYRPYSVGRAISKDGINWTLNPSSAVLSPDAGTWDNVTIDAPEVIRENGQYKMWYTSWKDNESPNYLGYATSPDGIHWTKYSGKPIFGPGTAAWEAGGPWFVSIIPFQGGYKMWYTGYTADFGTTAIGYATSADGIHWMRDTVHSPVLNVGASDQWDDSYVREPNVLAIGDSYYMWYVGDQTSGYGRTGLAVSKDGITNWTKYQANPVLVPGGAGAWDAERTCAGTVLRVGDVLHMWYEGWRPPHTSYQYSIGDATAQVVVPAVGDGKENIAMAFMLAQNYPNPFNPATVISYQLPVASEVRLSVYDLLGREVAVLVNERKAPGTYEVKFDAGQPGGQASGLPSGVYFYRLQARQTDGELTGNFVETKKMVVTK
jgi:beta-1,2-mannobiose phosphorylase / 1,2-beta-oligomannan phosphorylase